MADVINEMLSEVRSSRLGRIGVQRNDACKGTSDSSND